MEHQLQKEEELKKNLTSQQTLSTKAKSQNEAAVRASFIVEEKIAKSSRTFSEEEFLKSSIIRVCDVLCSKKRQIFGNVSMRRNTIADRIYEMAKDLRAQLMERAEISLHTP